MEQIMAVSYNNSDQMFCVVKRGKTLRIPVSEITYIESGAHKLYIHTGDEVYEYNDKMDHVAELLEPKGFLRCHQSYLVKLSEVSIVQSDKLTVAGKEVRISRKYKDKAKKILVGRDEPDNGKKAYLSEENEQSMGRLLCIGGLYAGKQFDLIPEQEVIIGRDGTLADIVINLPRVSRRHLRIIYHKDKDCYEITDFSTNGTYINGEIRLEQNVRYEVEMGETVQLAGDVTTFKLM
ncbi:MAG: LytTR family transcriptional regulator DNA-binding domain-containing protein [Lachnospiraceae bacterium]|nr:LytTR family transcriptional regulator DNA-binding domain-containing protein [Lachnospiraceae bacterium]